MSTLTLNFTPPTTAPANGYVVRYRVKGTTGAYTTVSPNPTSSPIVITGLLANTEYEGDIKGDCGGYFSGALSFSTCTCASGFTRTGSDTCEKVETEPANVFQTNYCLAPSTDSDYTSYFTRIYNSNYDNNDIWHVTVPDSSHVYAEMSTPVIWKNDNNSFSNGPLNRCGVWIDSDCDGDKDPLGGGVSDIIVQDAGAGYPNGTFTDVPFISFTGVGTGAKATISVFGGTVIGIDITSAGANYKFNDTLRLDPLVLGTTGTQFSSVVSALIPQKATVAFSYNNSGASRTVYVGIAGDNEFTLKVNGADIFHTIGSADTENFRIWHIIPVIIQGHSLNIFNVVGTGDGSVNDAVGMEVYDNTAAQIQAATNISQLNVLFTTATLRGTHIDVATCENGWTLDTSGGQGNYICKKVTILGCGQSEILT